MGVKIIGINNRDILRHNWVEKIVSNVAANKVRCAVFIPFLVK